MSVVSSATSLTNTYYLRNFYSNNRAAFATSTRRNYSSVELSYEDSLALHNAARRLQKYSYDSNENGSNIYSSIVATVDTYNNAMNSGKENGSQTVTRYTKQLKALSSKYSKELKAIGITVNSDGSLKANENLIKSSSLDDIKAAFGKDSGFTKQLERISKKMNAASREDVFTEATGKGTAINITV